MEDDGVNAPLGRLYASAPAAANERRRALRQPAWFEATLHTTAHTGAHAGAGSGKAVLVTDATLHGCCLKLDYAELRLGSIVSIGLEGEQPLAAIVRWLRDGMAGIEFLRAVTPESRAWYRAAEAGY